MSRLAVSLVVHAVLAALVVFVVGHRGEADAPAPTMDVVVVEVEPQRSAVTPTPTTTLALAPTTEGRDEPPARTARIDPPARQRGGSSGPSIPAAGEEGIPELHVETFGHGAGTGTGTGTGDGQGEGTGGEGDGRGTIGRLAQRPVVEPPPPPPPPKVSKARPAKLVWPNRDEELEAGHEFVAQVTVDREGFVVGAHLTKGQNGPRDADAASLVFRFRYEPALDDDGRPVKSQVEQQFQVR